MSEFEPRRDPKRPGLGRGFSVVLWTWLVLSLAAGVAAAVATSAAVDGPQDVAGSRRHILQALESVGYVVRGEYVVDSDALASARILLAACLVIIPAIVPYAIVVAARAGLRADAAEAAERDA
ncbi:hypothetical protein CLV49_0898 [Labedella gwakjiensis]|uniref:Uncharacterized protein n=1 Tax=Labedella gwakjiensis TaxID=390269 RepID=A0A2P8GTJ9_9MICO|nr:hypothetical protein [Labedella gwakjiensis]PSL37291.1 hypothetical protein CLV49_0898 [Labedella gwakjiensis]RUQ84617.1 hypothetical protein ELQ93_13510 [Labedella gwakjiensis]